MKSSRLFLVLASLLLAALPALRAAEGKVQLGLQTWTCNRMTFDQVVEFAVKHGITQLQFFSGQFDPAAPKEETLRKKAVLDAHGLTCYTFGVSRTSLDPAQNRQLFEFAKLIDAKLIIVEPRDLAEWDGLEALVKEYDIRLAIHNHGKGTVYGDPATVKGILAQRDSRIGVCLDVGWITAAGFDAAEVFKAYGNRVYDIHFKDKTVEPAADGKEVILDVPVGTGAANYTGLFAEIKRSGWSGVLAIETDNRSFQADPNQLVEEGKKFFAANFAK
ncbi:MAG TPA: sugar phosphate isomerase/epimerase [Lacunisphaera sp.]|nr:sugar phosphate isomerase/epimerase [Lacunisphaera sp.]